MWTCKKCGRIFEKTAQTHSCRKVPIESHFENNKEKAKELFEYLLKSVKKIGPVKIISLPCCIHLFSKYDFLAALPKKNSLEIRISLNEKLNNKRIKACVPLSKTSYKNCFEIASTDEVDNKLLNWIKKSYHLKTRQ